MYFGDCAKLSVVSIQQITLQLNNFTDFKGFFPVVVRDKVDKKSGHGGIYYLYYLTGPFPNFKVNLGLNFVHSKTI